MVPVHLTAVRNTNLSVLYSVLGRALNRNPRYKASANDVAVDVGVPTGDEIHTDCVLVI